MANCSMTVNDVNRIKLEHSHDSTALGFMILAKWLAKGI
jgi:hypothetical protein